MTGSLKAQVFQPPAIISVASSCTTLLTLLLFKDMRSKLFVQVIGCIALCDAIANSSYLTTQRPDNGTAWCSVEGFINLYFYPVSWVWTTILLRFLYELARYEKLLLHIVYVHLIAWGLPLVLTLLVLTTNTYGKPDDSVGTCSYGGDHEVGFIYHMATYYGLFILCTAYMAWMYWSISVIVKSQRKSTGSVSPTLTLALDSLQLYPISLIIMWSPRVIGVLLEFCFSESSSEDFDYFFLVAGSLKILHGMVAAIIFFYKSKGARTQWYELMVGILYGKVTRQTSDSITDYAWSDSISTVTSNPIRELAGIKSAIMDSGVFPRESSGTVTDYRLNSLTAIRTLQQQKNEKDVEMSFSPADDP